MEGDRVNDDVNSKGSACMQESKKKLITIGDRELKMHIRAYIVLDIYIYICIYRK